MPLSTDTNDLVYRLRKRAEIRGQIATRKSVQNNEPDRIADLLEEAATEIEKLSVKSKLMLCLKISFTITFFISWASFVASAAISDNPLVFYAGVLLFIFGVACLSWLAEQICDEYKSL